MVIVIIIIGSGLRHGEHQGYTLECTKCYVILLQLTL